MSLGIMIKSARQEKQVSLRSLAEKVGYHCSLLCEIEKGRRPMPENKHLLEAISAELDIDVEIASKQAEIDRVHSNPKKLLGRLMEDEQLSKTIVAASCRIEFDRFRDILKVALNEELKTCNA
jgi:transcriptional regulator with XRE-family HTH domain